VSPFSTPGAGGWLSNWGAQEVLAIDLNGQAEIMARVPNVLTSSIEAVPAWA
jgi:hypothetical protein